MYPPYITSLHSQVRKHFTADVHSHYVFTPRDLTQWVLGLLRYPLHHDSSSTPGEVLVLVALSDSPMYSLVHHWSDGVISAVSLLEMWTYEARRIFRDRLVGDKACDKFENILTSVLQTDWSVDLATSEAEGVFYVTWGHTPSTPNLSSSFGQQLGRLAAADMEEIVAKAIISYGKTYVLCSYCLNVN